MLMNRKMSLGKGLGALIPESETDETQSISKISIHLIKAREDQPRKNFDEEKIMQLSESIKMYGIIQPLVLKKDNEEYTIIAGERRFRAAKIAGISEIPAVIMDLSDKDTLEVSLIENIQREDLNPIEEARAYKRLISEFDLTQEELSIRVGKSRTAVTNSLRLLGLDERVQQYLIDGVITEGHGRTLLGITDNEMQYKISQKIIDESLSVRETERLIKNLSNAKNTVDKKQSNESPYYNEIKLKLQDLLGTKVNINQKKNNKGKIEIEYYSADDLQRILDILNYK